MCTYISKSAAIDGGGKGADGWFRVTETTVGFDHPSFTSSEHAILLDFTNPNGDDLTSRVAVELDIDSGRALLEVLSGVIAEAEASGVA